ncbi:MAG: M28 family peptidase [Ignavibacteria bacterium]|nr:M28 family peptidase [Ignavibacteria bacterium]
MKRIFSLVLIFCPTLLFSQEDFSQQNAAKILYHISEKIGPRPMGSPEEQQALQYAVEKFLEYGCDTAYIMPMTRTSSENTTSGIAVGIQNGTSARSIIIGGHLDTSGPEIPGTDDDGSGTACVMELSRVFGKRTMKSTLIFCCFGGEERGLEGSKYFADHFENIDNVQLMLQIDMANGLDIIDLDGDTYGISAPEWLVRASSDVFTSLGFSGLRYPTHFFAFNYAMRSGAGSDHESFLRKGIPAIDFTTDIDNPIHTPLDNWKNFDQRGLYRSGLVVQKLVERFDAGVPQGKPTQYWLYKIWNRVFFFSLETLWLLLILTFVLTLVAYFVLRTREQKRIELSSESLVVKKYRIPSLKLIIVALLISAVAWLLPDVLVWITGTRYPWFAQPFPYVLLSFIAGLFGLWFVLQFSQKLSLSPSSVPYFRTVSIYLILLTLLATNGNVKLSLYPVFFLLMISLSVFFKNGILQFVLVVIGFFFAMRIIFSEWFNFIARTVASSGELLNETLPIVLYNVIAVFVVSLAVIPFCFALAVIYRNSTQIQFLVQYFRSNNVGMILGLVFLGMIFWTSTNESYTRRLERKVKIEEHFDGNSGKQSITVKSNDYLSDVQLKTATYDTTIQKKILNLSLPFTDSLKHSWVTLEREKEISQRNDTITYNITLHISTTEKPYVVDVVYQCNNGSFRNIETPFLYTQSHDKIKFTFYSFPETPLHIPVAFQTIGDSNATEQTTVTFDKLFLPVQGERVNTYFILRSVFTNSFTYKP